MGAWRKSKAALFYDQIAFYLYSHRKLHTFSSASPPVLHFIDLNEFVNLYARIGPQPKSSCFVKD